MTLVLALIAVGLTLWMGPRMVSDLWVAEELTDAELGDLLSRRLPRLPAAGERLASARRLAEANGLSPASLPPMDGDACLLDVDNDGDLDVFLPRPSSPPGTELGGSSAAPAASSLPVSPLPVASPRLERPQLYLDDGTGRFREVGGSLGSAFTQKRVVPAGAGTWCLDPDRDGKLDLILPLADGVKLLLWNRLQDRHFLRAILRGPYPEDAGSGTPASGLDPGGVVNATARVDLIAGGRTQVRFVVLQPPDRAGVEARSVDHTAHFGLGEIVRAEQLIVTWPSGRRTELLDLEADREHEILQPRDDGKSSGEVLQPAR
jgi:hypothetical protein